MISHFKFLHLATFNNEPKRLNLDPGKKDKIYQESYKEHLKIS